MLAGGMISINSIKRKTNIVSRRTKIICTLGPACWEVEQLEKLISAGMSIARLNFSHGDHSGHKACLDRLRQAAANMGHNVAVMLDTKGPEIRSGFFADGASKINLVKGETIILTTDYSYKGNSHKLACSYGALTRSVKPGQSILVADGSLVLTVLTVHEAVGEVECRIENNASIGERKNMNLPGVVVELPTLTEKDIDDIVNFGIKNDVDFIAASFVRKATDVEMIRKVLNENGGGHIKIISKIENLEGLQNYEDILQLTDAIMVARGDLGMEIPPEKVFLAQKYMIREANIYGKPVITATQMLESMINNPRPTRAECSDVANAVFDGTDAVMLSGETANGPYFEQAVNVMVRTCCEAESSINFDSMFNSIRNSIRGKYNMSTGDSVASSAVKTSIDIGAKAIVVLSESGTTARLIAKFRPTVPVAVLTSSATVARQCHGLYKGCYSFFVDNLEETDSILNHVQTELVQFRIAKAGEPYVLVCGTQIGQGKTNQVRVQYISHDDEVGHGEFQSVESEAMGVDTSDVNKAKLMQGCSIM
jgi:pyruvate kinase